MEPLNIFRSQYFAALAMLEEAIRLCPDTVWNRHDGPCPFWEKAYHALFYTHLYLAEDLDHFTQWEGHIDPDSADLIPKEVVLAYLEFVKVIVNDRLALTELEAPSGFHWLPFNKFELQIYNIRHIQQHTGELFERLDHEKIELNWVGTAKPDNFLERE